MYFILRHLYFIIKKKDRKINISPFLLIFVKIRYVDKIFWGPIFFKSLLILYICVCEKHSGVWRQSTEVQKTASKIVNLQMLTTLLTSIHTTSNYYLPNCFFVQIMNLISVLNQKSLLLYKIVFYKMASYLIKFKSNNLLDNGQ